MEKEKYLKNSLNPVSLEGMEIITKQMKNSICKIYNKESTGTGFLCKLPYKSKMIPFLITNNHILNEEDIRINNKIMISFNNDDIYMNIQIDESRITLTNEHLDFTLIEIKGNEKKYKKNKLCENNHNEILNNDKINLEILDIDENYIIDGEFLNDKYEHNSIYTLHYPKDDKIVVSFGLIKGINKDKKKEEDKNKIKIQHYCCTDNGSSGAPILTLKDFKVIGIHYGSPQRGEFNEGTFIKSVILELEKYAKNNILQNDNNKASQLNVNDDLINNKMNVNYINKSKEQEKIISKNEYSQTILSLPEENYERYNIIFEESSKFKTIIIISSNKDVSNLFDIYKRNRKVKDSSNDKILFVYNGSFFNSNQNIKIKEAFHNLSRLNVIET